jgi:hypothetical protein
MHAFEHLHVSRWLLLYVITVTVVAVNTQYKRNTEDLVIASKEIGLEVNAEKT